MWIEVMTKYLMLTHEKLTMLTDPITTFKFQFYALHGFSHTVQFQSFLKTSRNSVVLCHVFTSFNALIGE